MCSKKKKSLLMKFKGSVRHSTSFLWWRNTLWWGGEVMRSRIPERYDMFGIQSKHITIQFPLRQTYLACNFLWLAAVGEGGGCSLFHLIGEGRSVCICMDRIRNITSVTSESQFGFFGQDATGNYTRCYIDESLHRMRHILSSPLFIFCLL